MSSSVQKEAIRRFADRVTPKSWHIVLDPKDERIQPGILNIQLSLRGPEEQIYTDFLGRKCYPFEHKDGSIWYANRYGDVFHRHQVRPILGMIDGRMVFKDIQTYRINCKGKVARIVIRLWPYLGDWKGTLIHELAHVAVYRYQAFRTKDYYNKTRFKNHWNIDLKFLLLKERLLSEGHHGPSFQQAFFTLSKRAIREFTTEIPYDDALWQTLRYELERLNSRRNAAV
jgi:hypothetical protein